MKINGYDNYHGHKIQYDYNQDDHTKIISVGPMSDAAHTTVIWASCVISEVSSKNVYAHDIVKMYYNSDTNKYGICPINYDDVSTEDESIIGIALADYTCSRNGMIPVLVEGVTVVNVPSENIMNIPPYSSVMAGEFLSINGSRTTDPHWNKSQHVILGQVMASNDDLEITSRYKDGDDDVYKIAVRFTGHPSPCITATADARLITAKNCSERRMQFTDIVCLKYDAEKHEWHAYGEEQAGFQNGVVYDTAGLEKDQEGQIMISGTLIYDYTEFYNHVYSSGEYQFNSVARNFIKQNKPIVDKLNAGIALSSNDVPSFGEYTFGMRVSPKLIPIIDGTVGNQFGIIDDIDNVNMRITITMDPVSTDAPSHEKYIKVETGELRFAPAKSNGFYTREEAQACVGQALKYDPGIHCYVACDSVTDHYEVIVKSVEPVEPELCVDANGTKLTLKQMRAKYGPGIYQDEFGAFWTILGTIGMGIVNFLLSDTGQEVTGKVVNWVGENCGSVGQKIKSIYDSIVGPVIHTITDNQIRDLPMAPVVANQSENDKAQPVVRAVNAASVVHDVNGNVKLTNGRPTFLDSEGNEITFRKFMGIFVHGLIADIVYDITRPVTGWVTREAKQDPVEIDKLKKVYQFAYTNAMRYGKVINDNKFELEAAMKSIEIDTGWHIIIIDGVEANKCVTFTFVPPSGVAYAAGSKVGVATYVNDELVPPVPIDTSIKDNFPCQGVGQIVDIVKADEDDLDRIIANLSEDNRRKFADAFANKISENGICAGSVAEFLIDELCRLAGFEYTYYIGEKLEFYGNRSSEDIKKIVAEVLKEQNVIKDKKSSKN